MLILMRNHFWKRWHKEYLSQLQQRVKWLHSNHSFKEGDLVLFIDSLVPPNKWPLARITKLHPGKDGLARVATLQTSTSEMKRPIAKQILLPVNTEASAHLVFMATAMVGGME